MKATNLQKLKSIQQNRLVTAVHYFQFCIFSELKILQGHPNLIFVQEHF